MIGKKNQMKNKLINEDAPSQATLQPFSRAYDDFSDDMKAALDHFNALNTKQKERYMDFLNKVFADSAWAKHDTGKKGKNIPFNNTEELDWPSVAQYLSREELEEQLDEIGFTEEARDKIEQLFHEAVEDRVSNDSFRIASQAAFQSFVDDYQFSPFIDDEGFNVVKLLAGKIEELENQIAYVENENFILSQDIKDNAPLEESFHFSPELRSQRRSSVNEWLNESHEEDQDAFYNDEQQATNLQMKNYLRYFGSE